MSYVTNPIANRLGFQQGWYNPLISLRSGVTNISFITYLKCYLLMQEYLRHNQINLVFFEIKPLQKNKKLIHLFVYQNLFHFEDHDSSFGTQNELKENGFLQLFMYLHQRKIKFNDCKLKKNFKINYSGVFYNNKFTTLEKIIQPNYRKYFKKLNKKLLDAKRKLITKRILMKRLILETSNIWDTTFKFNKRIKYNQNIYKNAKFYKKIRLAWKISKLHFRNVKRFKKTYKKRNKWWVHKHKNKFKTRSPKLTRQQISETAKLFLRSHQKKLKKIKIIRLKKKFMQVPKSKRLRARTASTKKKTNKYVRQTKKKIFKNLISFIRVFKKLKSNQRKLVGEKKKKQNEIQTHDRRLRKRQPKKKKKIILKIQNNKFTKFLQIRKLLNKKSFAQLIEERANKRGQKFKTMKYVLWHNFIFQPLMPKLLNVFFKIRQLPKNFHNEWAKLFEKNKWANPLQFIFFIKSYMALNQKRKQKRKLHAIYFKKTNDKRKNFQLIWKNRALYDLKSKSIFNVSQSSENRPLAFTRYMGFMNTYHKHQKFSKIDFFRMSSIKQTGKIKTKKVDKYKFYLDNYEKQFQKINVEFKIFIEKYIQSYLKFPVMAKIKNISDFIDLRSNQKKIKYQTHIFLKPLAGKNFFIRLLFTLLNMERIFNPQVFIDLIATEMQKTTNYKHLVSNMIYMFSILHSEHIMGYKVLIDGKLGGSKGQSSKQIFKLQRKEKIPVQTFKKNVSYALGVARTRAGLFGIRMWLYY